MRQANINSNGRHTGVLVENDMGYVFTYAEEYLRLEDAKPISLTMPLTSKPYKSKELFPFFDGLIPEGWLLDIAEQNWKLDRRDRMGLLLACCHDCIGNISVEPFEDEE